MDKNATPNATDDASPSPFRRFPWVQLVFCVACLGMAAWTWMRFSYCWNVTIEDLRRRAARIHSEGVWPCRAYVRFMGTAHREMLPEAHAPSFYATGLDRPRIAVSISPVRPAPNPLPGVQQWFAGRVLRCIDATHWHTPEKTDEDMLLDLRTGDPRLMPTVFIGVSRFTGASVAGLVVGAMGVFIFGLYLRRWVKERRAV